MALRRLIITSLVALAALADAFEVAKIFKAAQTAVVPVAAAALIASPGVAFAGDAGKGGGVFEGNCAACHAGGQNVIMPDKTLEKQALEQYLDGGYNEAAVIKQVTNGKGAMPAFGGRLSDVDISNVRAASTLTRARAVADTGCMNASTRLDLVLACAGRI